MSVCSPVGVAPGGCQQPPRGTLHARCDFVGTWVPHAVATLLSVSTTRITAAAGTFGPADVDAVQRSLDLHLREGGRRPERRPHVHPDAVEDVPACKARTHAHSRVHTHTHGHVHTSASVRSPTDSLEGPRCGAADRRPAAVPPSAAASSSSRSNSALTSAPLPPPCLRSSASSRQPDSV